MYIRNVFPGNHFQTNSLSSTTPQRLFLNIIDELTGDAHHSVHRTSTLQRITNKFSIHKDLQEILDSLDRDELRLIEEKVGKKEFNTIFHLCQEANEELLAMSLHHFALRLKKGGRDEAALRIFFLVMKIKNASSRIKNQSRREIETMVGGGDSIADRMEYLVSKSLREIVDPKMIFPMMGAWTLGKVVGCGVMGFLKAQGIGAISFGIAGGMASYLTEVPLYVGLRKLVGVDEDWIRAGRMIGIMKLAGGAAEGIIGLTNMGKTGSAILHQMSMYTGLEIERIHDGGDPTSLSFHLETLWSMLSLSIGMSLGTKLLGRGYQHWVAELGVREAIYQGGKNFWRGIGSRIQSMFDPIHWVPNPAWAFANDIPKGMVLGKPSLQHLLTAPLLASSALSSPGRDGKVIWLADVLDNPALQRIYKIARLPHDSDPKVFQDQFDCLAETLLKDPKITPATFVAALKQLVSLNVDPAQLKADVDGMLTKTLDKVLSSPNLDAAKQEALIDEFLQKAKRRDYSWMKTAIPFNIIESPFFDEKQRLNYIKGIFLTLKDREFSPSPFNIRRHRRLFHSAPANLQYREPISPDLDDMRDVHDFSFLLLKEAFRRAHVEPSLRQYIFNETLSLFSQGIGSFFGLAEFDAYVNLLLRLGGRECDFVDQAKLVTALTEGIVKELPQHHFSINYEHARWLFSRKVPTQMIPAQHRHHLMAYHLRGLYTYDGKFTEAFDGIEKVLSEPSLLPYEEATFFEDVWGIGFYLRKNPNAVSESKKADMNARSLKMFGRLSSQAQQDFALRTLKTLHSPRQEARDHSFDILKILGVRLKNPLPFRAALARSLSANILPEGRKRIHDLIRLIDAPR